MLWDVLGDGGWKYGHVFHTGYTSSIRIRTCFRHLRVAFVGCMQYAPARVTCRTSKYEYVFRTGYMFRLGIRICFPNWTCVTHRNTNVFSEPGTRHPSRYGYVFRIGYTLPTEIRPCFSYPVHVIHQNTAVFSELGEGVDEPEDGEEDDGGAYDAVQYADTANVEPSAEARHEVGDQQPPQDGSGGNTGQTNGHVPDAG